MAEKSTGTEKEPCQLVLLCPLCRATQTSIGHLMEHLKNVHKPRAELGSSSKCDGRPRLFPKQKTELAKAMRENHYKSKEYKYSLIQGIAAPESPIPIDDALPPFGKDDVKSPVPVPQSWNLQEYIRDHTESTRNMFRVLGERDQEGVIQHLEELLHILRITAADAKGATMAWSPHHLALVPTTPQPSLACPFPVLGPPIPGQVTFEASLCPSNASNQAFMASGLSVQWEPSEWLEDAVLDPEPFKQED